MRNIEEHVKSLAKDMDKRIGELKVQVDNLQQIATKAFARKPVLTLGVAFVAGMAVGIALSKSSD